MSSVYVPLMRDYVTPRLGGEGAKLFRAATCYSVDDVLPLFGDWQREWERRDVSRALPHENVWVEWQSLVSDDAAPGATGEKCTAGCWFFPAPAIIPPAIWAQPQWHGLTRRYAFATFARLPVSVPLLLPETGLLAMDEEGKNLEIALLPPLRADVAASITWPLVAEPMPITGFHAVMRCWPALMAFSLLHCANVEEEKHEPSSAVRSARKRKGQPPLTVYRSLRIVLPQSVAEGRKRLGTESADEPMVRRHLCRGHFHTYHSPRFKKMQGRTVWYPEHWRGDETVGTVQGPRRVVLPAEKDSEKISE